MNNKEPPFENSIYFSSMGDSSASAVLAEGSRWCRHYPEHTQKSGTPLEILLDPRGPCVLADLYGPSRLAGLAAHWRLFLDVQADLLYR